MDEKQSVWELIQSHLRQPEYLHVLFNPLPVYGLAFGAIALVIAIALRNRAAQIVALALVLLGALSAWPTIHYGEIAYDRILTQADAGGNEWLDAHGQRGERAEPAFYVLAVIAATALALPWKLPKTATALNFITLVATLAVLALGIWVAYAGGQIRHSEFRYGSPPEPRGGYDKMRD
jgi:hypothetical protein